MNHNKRVLVAMSGGVDSSVAACLLAEQGYDVVGVFMRLGAAEAARGGADVSLPVVETESDDGGRHRGCCSAADAADARAVAGQLGIPFYALNFEQDFSRLIDYFADEYAAARTPNPCVMCNQWLKFGKLLAYAKVVGADWIATGHYARIDRACGAVRLRQARDLDKDQSYVLFGTRPDVLERTLLPIGDMTKEAVRDHARRFGLRLHDKPESQDICFAQDGDYARVVRSRRPDAFRPGEIRDTSGRVLGRHEGLPQFTIGQRRGLGVAAGHPIYVTALEHDTATVVVGERTALERLALSASEVNWQGPVPPGPIRAAVKIRYQHAPAAATVMPVGADRAEVCFDAPQRAITPGQAAVFYAGDVVLGGGWID